MGKPDSAMAAQRFGLGARPGDLVQIGNDPRGWLTAQIVAQPMRPVTLADVAPVTERIAAIRAERQARQERKQNAAVSQGGDQPASQPTGQAVGQTGPAAKPTTVAAGDPLRQLYMSDIALRCRAAVVSETPLIDRLVYFWSNHFTVSALRPVVAPLALSFETEAIRPHIFGRFVDMLLASTQHPAMLLYLDNAQSIGPMSRMGAQRARGLNENLARELMELQTLGVDSGYSQNDVHEVAKILTGWTIAGLGGARQQGNNNQQASTNQQGGVFRKAALARLPQPGDDGSGFRFAPGTHEPGDKIVLGKTYSEGGEAEGQALLQDLARHPATASHIATKIARHFIGDEPPAAAVQILTRTYLDSDGDLAVLTRKLISMDVAWQQPAQKIRTPNDWVIASCRALQIDGDDLGKRCLGALRQLGQLPFMAPSPAGWSDLAADWLSPEALMTRIDLARVMARRPAVTAATNLDPRQLLRDVLGPGISHDTAFQIDNAPSKADAVALLLVSPEFMRR